MSIFDTISSSIGSLFDGDASGAWDTISNISGSDLFGAAKGAVKGYDALMKNQKSEANEQDALLGFIERNSRMQNTDQEGRFRATPTKPTQSVDPQVIEREWQSFLTGVAGSKSVPGKRYSELN